MEERQAPKDEEAKTEALATQDTPASGANEIPTAELVIAELDKARSDLLYLRAEFENYRKRMQRDQEQSVRFANEKFIRDLLPTVDLLDRALKHAEKLSPDQSSSLKSFVDGIGLTNQQLGQTLERFGVELIGIAGEKFDPQRHEAISKAESAGDNIGMVVEVLHRGCLLHGRLLEPAKVVVAIAPIPKH
jgi:molecular chaperone GrpE